jgi:hypothetical protein
VCTLADQLFDEASSFHISLAKKKRQRS